MNHARLLCSVGAAVWSATAAFGQAPTPRGFGDLFEQAPPHIDQALRARVDRFYALHQEKKWRAADALVHEDAKDTFFGAEKLTFRSFRLVRIAYRDNFARADVVIDIDTDMFIPGFGQMAVHRPLTSTWRFDRNEWWWGVAPVNCRETPWNTMFCGGDPAQPGGGDGPPIPAALENFSQVLADLKSKVSVDRTGILLPGNVPAEAEVAISNHWDSAVHLSIDVPDRSGLSLHIDKPLLPAGETTQLRIRSRPESHGAAVRPPIVVRLTVEELRKVVELQISFQPSPATVQKP